MTIINDRTKILHRVEIDNDWLWDSDDFIRGGKDSGSLIYSVLLHDDKDVTIHLMNKKINMLAMVVS